MKRLFLIGYMGSGKTTIGKLLSKKLGLQFVDLDLFIENRYRKSVTQLFAEKGESVFREIEHKTLVEISEFENIVVSTGGGTPCFYDNMSLMNQSGITIYLKVSENELSKRLAIIKQNRPLVKNKNKEELRSFINENLSKRESFYNQASLIFDAEQLLTHTDVDNIVTNLILTMNK